MRRKRSRAGERKRDEQRSGGPRIHGREWHDHDEPRRMTPDLTELDALPEAEGSGERAGMGKGQGASRK